MYAFTVKASASLRNAMLSTDNIQIFNFVYSNRSLASSQKKEFRRARTSCSIHSNKYL